MKIRLVLVLGSTVAALMLLLAPAALAVQSSVRVEAAGFTALPATSVDESSGGGTYYDPAGHSATTTKATAFGATALATGGAGLPWDFSSSSLGVFVNSFAAQTADPTTFANWWSFVVNGYSAPVGAADLGSVAGDSYLWFQNPDATFSLGSYLLVATPGATALSPGQALAVSVTGDDLSKVDSQADATRFDIANANLIQTPSQFPAIAGATIHVGDRTYPAAGSQIQIANIPKGTWWVWADKPADSQFVYARSARFQINVGDAPEISALAVKPAKYTRNKLLKISYTTSKDVAQVGFTVKTASGKVIGGGTFNQISAGARSIVWSGGNVPAKKKLGKALTISLGAVDSWGRQASQASITVPVK